jgi:hypothetical protein
MCITSITYFGEAAFKGLPRSVQGRKWRVLQHQVCSRNCGMCSTNLQKPVKGAVGSFSKIPEHRWGTFVPQTLVLLEHRVLYDFPTILGPGSVDRGSRINPWLENPSCQLQFFTCMNVCNAKDALSRSPIGSDHAIFELP